MKNSQTADTQKGETKLPVIKGQKNSQVNSVGHNRMQANVSPRLINQPVSLMQQVDKKVSKGNIWIVKPGENSNRGHGITVCSKLKEIKQIISQSDYDKTKTFIV